MFIILFALIFILFILFAAFIYSVISAGKRADKGEEKMSKNISPSSQEQNIDGEENDLMMIATETYSDGQYISSVTGPAQHSVANQHRAWRNDQYCPG